MEVMPVGEQRDRQIADKRGDIKYYKCLRHNSCNDCEASNSESCSDMIIDGPRIIKPYSTDIAAAMELWAEMFTPQFHNLCVWDLYISGFCPSKSNPEHYFSANVKNTSTNFKYRTGNIRHATVNEAIADAISGAFIKWKGGE